jgi:hypothetical protein
MATTKNARQYSIFEWRLRESRECPGAMRKGLFLAKNMSCTGIEILDSFSQWHIEAVVARFYVF